MKTAEQVRKDLQQKPGPDKNKSSRGSLLTSPKEFSNDKNSYGQPKSARNSARNYKIPYEEIPISATLSKWSKHFNN
jgi:hypothetical protein